MYFDDEIIKILDEADELNNMILRSESYLKYKHSYIALQENNEVQALKSRFLKSKEKYDEVNRFGRYHPDYHSVMLSTRKLKKAYDMHPEVANVKQLETDLQSLLDDIQIIIASSISKSIKVETGNPFFEQHNCSTGCGCS